MGLNTIHTPQFNLAMQNALRKSRRMKLAAPIDLFIAKEMIKKEAGAKGTTANGPKQ